MVKVLDVGCGGSAYFSKHKIRGSINCDILKPIKKIINFVLCDAHHLPFKDKEFTKVFLYDIIEHLENPTKALKEAKRVLIKNGLIKIGTPNCFYLPKIIRSMFKKTYSPYKGHIYTWGKPELINLLSNIGSKLIVEFKTYRDEKKPIYYDLSVMICPFSFLKFRQLEATIYI